MKRLLKFPTENVNQSILVEIDEPEASGLVKASRTEKEALAVKVKLEEALQKSIPAVTVVAGLLKTIQTAGAQAEIAFSIRLTAEGDVIITPSSEQGNFRLTVRTELMA